MKKIFFYSNVKTFLIFNISLLFTNIGFSNNFIYNPIHKECKSQISSTSKLQFEELSMYWLNLTSNLGHFSQMAVGYTSEATLGVDRGIDGLNINNQYYLCSSIDDSPYTIQGRPSFVDNDVVPIVFKIAEAGDYAIDIYNVSGLFFNQEIFIVDKLTNSIHDLKSGPYLFSSNVGTFKNRFDIVYQNKLDILQTTNAENSVIFYKQNQELVINTVSIKMADVNVFDLTGRLLFSKNNISDTRIKIYAGITKEVLIVKITTDTNKSITKKIIM